MLFQLQRPYTRINDAELVELVARGNERAFNELLVRYQNDVYQLTCRFLGDPLEAEDITQETFLRLFRTACRYTPQASLRTFLFRIAKNLCIDFVRKKRPEFVAELPETGTSETPLSCLERAQTAELLERCVNVLPENQRMAILLRYVSGLRYQEIAEVMSVTVSAVESLLVRARKTLRKRMANPSV